MPSLRPLRDDDLPAVLALNETNVELLAPLSEGRLRDLRNWADRCDVVEVGGGFAGFVITFGPETAYDSENYAWFSQRHDDFYYLDRIVLDSRFRRRGLGGFVYDEMEAVAAGHGLMTLEVNLLPPNPVSLAFHESRGYVEVGQIGDSLHRVVLMEKLLPPVAPPVASPASG